jgi:hypothetical protein
MAIRTPEDLLHELMGKRDLEGRVGELFAEAVTEILRLRAMNVETVERFSTHIGRISDALYGLDIAVRDLLKEMPKSVLKTMPPIILRRVDQALVEAAQARR